MFDEFLVPRGLDPFTDDDYLRYVDGKPRFDGVRSFLASRGIELPTAIPPTRRPGLRRRPRQPQERPLPARSCATTASRRIPGRCGSSTTWRRSARSGRRVVVAQRREVLDASGLAPRFEVVTDGMVAAAEHIAGKPAPDMFLTPPRGSACGPADAVVIEDAVSGVAAGRAGDFGLVIGVDRGAGADALREHGADLVVDDLAELLDSHSAPEHLDLTRFPLEPWRFVEKEHDPKDLGLTETLFAVANGYLGMRANPEEGREAHSHGTYLNGFHETWSIHHAEDAFGFAKLGQTIVNVPDAKLMKLYIDDEPLLLTNADLEAYERVLDFRGRHVDARPDLADPRRQAGPGALATARQPGPPPPGDADVRGDDARRQRAGRGVVADAQPPGRRGRVPRRPPRPRPRHRPAQDALVRPPRPRAAPAPPRPPRPLDDGVVLGYRCANSGMTLACAYRHVVESSCEHHAETTVGEDLAKTVFTSRMREGDVAADHQARHVPHVDRRAGRGARRPLPPHARPRRRRRPRHVARRAARVARRVLGLQRRRAAR